MVDLPLETTEAPAVSDIANEVIPQPSTITEPEVPKEIHMINPDGESGYVPIDQYQTALAQGFREPTKEEVAKKQLEEEYSTPEKEIKAGIAGAARGLTFGLSDLASWTYSKIPEGVKHIIKQIDTVAPALGIQTPQLSKIAEEFSPEEMEKLKEQSPYISGAAEIGGVAAGLLGPGFPGLLAKGTTKIGEALVEKPLASLTSYISKALVDETDKVALAAAKKKFADIALGKATQLDLGLTEGIAQKAIQAGEQLDLGLGKAFSLTGKIVEAPYKIVPKLMDTLTPAQKFIVKGAGKVFGSAVEGAAYGLGNVVTEHSLGDIELNSENMLADAKDVGMSALFSGAIGLGAPIVTGGIEGSLTLAKKGYNALSDFLVGTGKGGEKGIGILGKGFTSVSSWVSGVPREELRTKWANRLMQMPDAEKKASSQNLSKDLNENFSSLNDGIRETNNSVKKEAIGETINAIPVEDAKTHVNDFQLKLSKYLEEINNNPAKYSSYFSKDLETLNKEIDDAKNKATTPKEYYDILTTGKRKIDDLIPWGKNITGLTEQNSIGSLKDLRGSLNDLLKDEGKWGISAKILSDMDDVMSERFRFVNPYGKETDFSRAFMKKVQTPSGNKFEFDPGKMYSVMTRAASESMAGLKAQEQMKMLSNYISSIPGHIETLESVYSKVGKTLDPKYAQMTEGLQGKLESAAADLKSAKGAPAKYAGVGEEHLTEKAFLGLGAHELGVNTKTLGAIGVLTQAYGMLKNPIATMTKLAQMEKAIARIGNAIDNGTRTLVKGADLVVSKGRGYIAAGVSSQFGNTRERNESNFKRRVNNIQSVTQDPMKFMDNINQATKDIHPHAPQISQMISQKASTAASFLASKIPQHGKSGLLDSDWKFSQTEMSVFNRYYEAVKNPMKVLKQASAGTLTPEAVEAVQTVYPKLFEQMQSSIMRHLIDVKPEKISHQKKVMLSMITGQKMTGTLDPIIFGNIQASYGLSQMENKQVNSQLIKPTSKGASSLTLGTRTNTMFNKDKLDK